MKKQRHISPFVIVTLSFLALIIIGSFLLVLPCMRKDGQVGWSHFLQNVFTACSATCVTGLILPGVGVGNEYTIAGQAVVVILMQIGGIGLITFLTFFINMFRKKMQFKDRYFLSKALYSNTVAGVGKFARNIILLTLLIEFLAILAGLPVYMKMYPGDFKQALWTSTFMSVSAFNTAGIDPFGNTSLMGGATINSAISTLKMNHHGLYIYFLSYLMIVELIGGISFLCILEIFSFKKKPKNYSAFTKIVLIMTSIIVVFGTISTYAVERLAGNLEYTFIDSLFLTISASQTTGFSTLDPTHLTYTTKSIIDGMMFIGGAPISTAAGIKVTTLFVIVLALFSFCFGRKIQAFKRKYSNDTVLKAICLAIVAFTIIIIGYLIIAFIERDDPSITGQNILFDCFSSFGTVGLSCTQGGNMLKVGSKVVLAVLMFLGRIGTLTFVQMFYRNSSKQKQENIQLIEEDLIIG